MLSLIFNRPLFDNSVPPLAPTLLTAVPGSTIIKLSWAASSNTLTYNLYRGFSSGTETLYQTGIVSTNFVDTGLTNGVTYYYYVTAVNGAGQSPPSNEVSAVPAGHGGKGVGGKHHYYVMSMELAKKMYTERSSRKNKEDDKKKKDKTLSEIIKGYRIQEQYRATRDIEDILQI